MTYRHQSLSVVKRSGEIKNRFYLETINMCYCCCLFLFIQSQQQQNRECFYFQKIIEKKESVKKIFICLIYDN